MGNPFTHQGGLKRGGRFLKLVPTVPVWRIPRYILHLKRASDAYKTVGGGRGSSHPHLQRSHVFRELGAISDYDCARVNTQQVDHHVGVWSWQPGISFGPRGPLLLRILQDGGFEAAFINVRTIRIK